MVDARAGDDDDEAPSSSSSSSDEEDDEEEEEGEGEDEGQEGGDNVTKGGSGGTSSGIRAPSPTPDGAGATGTAATTAIAAKGGGRRARRARGKKGRGGVEAERRRRVCALHGCGAALVLLLKGASVRAACCVVNNANHAVSCAMLTYSHQKPHSTFQGTGSAVVPAALLEDVMATAKQLVNQAFGPQAQARRWATGVRTGWAIFGALLHQVGGAGRHSHCCRFTLVLAQHIYA